MLNGISLSAKPLEKLRPLLKPAGAAILNLEIPLTTASSQTPNKSRADIERRSQFVLKADPQHASALATIGVDAVSLGNNHAMDYGQPGLDEMRDLLSQNSVLFAGAGVTRQEALAPAVFEAEDGTRIGLLSALAFMGDRALGYCTPAKANAAGVATLPFGGVIGDAAKKSLATWISAARKQSDLVVIGLHWGLEKQTSPTAYQVALGRACIEAGADVVWGNHPHVLQGAEVYKGKPILYSMGNLVSPKGGDTGLLKLVYENRKFSWAQFLPLVISGGKVKPVNGKQGQRAVKAFEGLCAVVQKRYPHKRSAALLPAQE
jgi:poly-gamma-glutamate synthesis protein (capsule biosynthesis protein)